MRLNELNRWRNFWFLPTYCSLQVFDALSGKRVASWTVYRNVHVQFNEQTVETCCIICDLNEMVNVDLKNDRTAFNMAVSEWSQMMYEYELPGKDWAMNIALSMKGNRLC